MFVISISPIKFLWDNDNNNNNNNNKNKNKNKNNNNKNNNNIFRNSFCSKEYQKTNHYYLYL